MTILILLVHIVVCLVLILVVLLQTGKRADLAGAFGGGGSQTAFGARGAATFLSKATAWSAGIFMVTSLVLGVRFGRETNDSVVKDFGSTAPAVPQAPPPQPPPVQPSPAPGQTPPPAPAPPEGEEKKDEAKPETPPAPDSPNPPSGETKPPSPK